MIREASGSASRTVGNGSDENMGWNDLIGMRLDQRYDILDELGRGGSSRVYHAFDSTSERDVAIKVIPNDAEDRSLFVSRFKREVDAVQQLHHPNIVAVYGAGKNDDFVYLVMQLVTGGTVRRKLNGPLPVEEAARYVVQIAYALQHAHEQGIIHRDVKPSNMLLEYPGSEHVLLTDFGIAKIQGARGLTKSGTTLGTPEYMSPEQAEGREIDERSDIYALGCVLYETLAGRPPFLGSTSVSVLFQHVHSRPAYIRGFNPGVPAEMVQILEIALAKRPDERYGTAEAFARALRPIAGELPDVTAWHPETTPIVIAPSRGLTPSRPLPRGQRLTESSLTDNPPAIPGVADETTAHLPAISARKTQPPFTRARHTLPPMPAARSGPTGRSRKSRPPSHGHRTLPPFVRVRRAPSLSEMNLPLRAAETGERPAPPTRSPREPIPLPLGEPRHSAFSGPLGTVRAERGDEDGEGFQPPQRGPTSRPSPSSQPRAGNSRIPVTWPQSRPPFRRLAVIIAAAVVVALFGWLALNLSGLRIALGGATQPQSLNHPTQTVAPTATLAATATLAPTSTTGPQPTATQTQQQILNQRAFGSFDGVTMASFSDGSCSSSNKQSTFNAGQLLYVNLCTSSYAISAPMTVAIRQNGQVLYRMVYGKYISPSSSYYYYTNHFFSSGTYDVLVTLDINGTTAVARDLTLYIR
jgi:serine/threonine-protein kinase